jgi:hypothetical protein
MSVSQDAFGNSFSMNFVVQFAIFVSEGDPMLGEMMEVIFFYCFP